MHSGKFHQIVRCNSQVRLSQGAHQIWSECGRPPQLERCHKLSHAVRGTLRCLLCCCWLSRCKAKDKIRKFERPGKDWRACLSLILSQVGKREIDTYKIQYTYIILYLRLWNLFKQVHTLSRRQCREYCFSLLDVPRFFLRTMPLGGKIFFVTVCESRWCFPWVYNPRLSFLCGKWMHKRQALWINMLRFRHCGTSNTMLLRDDKRWEHVWTTGIYWL